MRNDSNESLRFSRSWQEATGERIHSSHFPVDNPHPSIAEVLACLSVAILLGVIVGALWVH